LLTETTRSACGASDVVERVDRRYIEMTRVVIDETSTTFNDIMIVNSTLYCPPVLSNVEMWLNTLIHAAQFEIASKYSDVCMQRSSRSFDKNEYGTRAKRNDRTGE